MACRTYSVSSTRLRVDKAASPRASRIGTGVADGDALAQQVLQHPLHRGKRELFGHQILHHLGLFDSHPVQHLSWRPGARTARGRAGGPAPQMCVPSTLTASTTVYPAARACSARSIGNPPGRQCRRPARAWPAPSSGCARLARGDGQFAALRQLVAGDLHALERNHVFARAQRQVVGHPHRRQQITEIRRPAAGGCRRCASAAASSGAPSTICTSPSPTSIASGSTFSRPSRFSRAGLAGGSHLGFGSRLASACASQRFPGPRPAAETECRAARA